MFLDYSPPMPDEQKLIGKIIESYKTTKDAALRSKIARIYTHGQMTCVMSGHPQFVEAKKEEDMMIKPLPKKMQIQKKNEIVKNQNRENSVIKNVNSTGNSTLTFSMPVSCVSLVKKQRCLKKNLIDADEGEQYHSKKMCEKISPGPSLFNTSNTWQAWQVMMRILINLNSNESMWNVYLDLGAPNKYCSKCEAVIWNQERNNKSAPNKSLTFSLCSKNGQVILDKEKQPPEPLATLLTGGVHFKHFKQNIWIYNCMFSMSSTGGKIDPSINRGGAPYCFKIEGVNYHNIGSLVPTNGNTPKFYQLYIYDTEDEINNKMNAVNDGRDAVNEEIVQSLLHMLDQHNRLVKGFHRARERVRQNVVDEFKLVLISASSASGRPNHIAPSNEVAGLIVTTPYAKGFRDTIIDSRVDGFQRIYETDPHATETEDPDERGPREHISMKEFYNYKLMIRPSKGLTPHLGGCLWQQYVVDAFTTIEQYRLDWIRDHQTTIRFDLYHNIRDTMQQGDVNPSNVGHPSLFLTMTTNAKWPEIQRMLKYMPGVDVADAPDVVARVFKMKNDQLMDMTKKKNCFGRCIGGSTYAILSFVSLKFLSSYVIKLQKRGLAHTHILIWLHPDDRPKTTDQIDSMVSAEIPDPDIDPLRYNIVSNYMIHGPCGSNNPKSPCMVKGNCIKHFPKWYNSHTFFDECGFPVYKRMRTGITIKKKGVNLDNCFVVPFNRDLLEKNKGSSAPMPKNAEKRPIDEGWRCFGGCLRQSKFKKSKLEAWFDANQSISNARNYSYSEFPNKFTWHPRPGIWKERKRGDVIGRLSEVHSSSGELLYLRMLLLRKKGAKSFQDLKTFNEQIHETFKEACSALGLLQNDNQWHEAIAENSHTSLSPQLRVMFVNILSYSLISDPLRLWEAHW
ncbi:uncharacterized protein LOC141674090 [Apium graveolens]|uniref:uncharacterized protein LOC141674090 n=1 Tax=Apium graveolens TaxID=4045 RepID=UPI003D790151